MTGETALQKILENGLLGALLVVAFIVVYYLYKENCKVKEERYTDMKDLLAKDLQFREEIKNFLNNISEFIKGEKK